MKNIKVALVAAGGRGSRLQAEGVEVPLSKPFLDMDGNPFIHHALLTLQDAGVQDIIVSVDSDEKYKKSEEIIFRLRRELGFRANTMMHVQPGEGAHGVPWHAKDAIDGRTFMFCAGHDPQTAAHYKALDVAKDSRNAVFSVFPYDPRTNRPVYDIPRLGSGVPAHPIVGDSNYIDLIEKTNFNIGEIINTLIADGRMTGVKCETPPEFDLLSEYYDCIDVFSQRTSVDA